MRKQAKAKEATIEATLAEQVAQLAKQVETLTELVHKGHQQVPITTRKEVTKDPSPSGTGGPAHVPSPTERKFDELKELIERMMYPWPHNIFTFSVCHYCGGRCYPNQVHSCGGSWTF
jgi:hypothetical protein